MAVFLIGYRNPDLSLRRPRLNLDLQDDLCEDVPAWWLSKKKKTMYHTGGTDARSVRSLMQFMMHAAQPAGRFRPRRGRVQGHPGVSAVARAAEISVADRPGAGRPRARRSSTKTCARCHGTYGEKWTYPNKIVPIDEIGTDRRRSRRHHAEVRRLLQQELVRRRLQGDGHGRLPGAAARRHLGHGTVLPQRLRCRRSITSSTRRPGRKLFHALVSHGPGRLRRREAGLEDRGAERSRRTRRNCRRWSSARCTTRRRAAAATAATPSATASARRNAWR